MRMTVLIVLAACAAAGAQQSGELEWSATRKLRRSDFKGSIAAASDVAARSAIEIKATWMCENERLIADVRAVFNTSKSWWGGSMRNGWDPRRSNVSDSQLLEHEQIHFDLAETIARKLREHLSHLDDACTRYGGTVPLAAVVEDYQRELDEQQSRYDHETGFGRDARMQWAWQSKTQQALKPKR